LLEPNLPNLDKRLGQLEKLVSIFGPDKIAWRFDPICFYKENQQSHRENNLSDFTMIADRVSRLGIKKCVTSFFDNYTKIQKRVHYLNKKNKTSLIFVDPSMDKKKQVIHRMENYLAPKGIKLFLCCEKELFSSLDQNTTVLENACIDSNILKTIYGGNPEVTRDYGQRAKQGCKCTKSIDIGSYEEHPCFHDCLFCYANPEIDNLIQKH